MVLCSMARGKATYSSIVAKFCSVVGVVSLHDAWFNYRCCYVVDGISLSLAFKKMNIGNETGKRPLEPSSSQVS